MEHARGLVGADPVLPHRRREGAARLLAQRRRRQVHVLDASGAVTAWIDSELVRTSSPIRAERRGRAPLCLQLASSWLVPRAPAATTTPPAVKVRARRRSHAPGCTVETA